MLPNRVAGGRLAPPAPHHLGGPMRTSEGGEVFKGHPVNWPGAPLLPFTHFHALRPPRLA